MRYGKAHCESCGRDNPESSEGYTACCNELVCYGSRSDKYGIPSNFRVACCWAKATILFGGDDKVPDHGSRLS